MAEANQSLMVNMNKRKLSGNFQETDFPKKKTLINDSGPSSAFSLIEKFLIKEQSKGKHTIHNHHFQPQFWQREHLLLQFLELALEIMSPEFEGLVYPYNLELVLKDIEALGLAILGQNEHPGENAYTLIVTSALEVSKGHELHPDDKDGLVKVEPKPEKGLISNLIDDAVKMVVNFLFPHKEESYFIKGNFAPIREETSPTSDLIVHGDIPSDLNGMMIRNGPNPPFDPVAYYGWLDGDSMLHAIRFKGGKATFVSRYLQTSRFKQEQFFENSEFLQYGDLDGPFGLLMSCVQLLKAKLKVLDVSYGWLNGQEGFAYQDGMLMVLQDWNKPYVCKISQNGDLETLGINDYGKRLNHNVVPHTKKDPNTGELFIIGASYTPPYAIYNFVTKQGVLSNPVPITVEGPTYMHDLGITHNYVIFMDLCYCYDPENMVKNCDWIYMFDINKKPRFGILPKYATTEEKMKWFEFDDMPFFIYHNGNAWEEDDDTIVLFSCLMVPDLDNMKCASMSQTNTGGGTHFARSLMGHELPKRTKLFFNPAHVHNGPSGRRGRLLNPPQVHSGPGRQGIQTLLSLDKNSDKDISEAENVFSLPLLYKFTFNMKTGEHTKEPLSQTRCDFPKINDSYLGRKTRYMYTSHFNQAAKIPAIVKNDLKWKTELKLDFGGKKYGSQVVFSPRQINTPSMEDDGYLTTFVHDEKINKSFAYVICAQKMELLAMIELTSRVPYGFHSKFVTEDEIQHQKLI